MNILVIGSGGREHAMVQGLKRSHHTKKIYVLPGNGGINLEAEQVKISVDDFAGIADFCKNNKIALVVVGPEAPLVAGIVDYLDEQDIRVFGPSKKAAQLEGSKQFMKDIAKKYGMPTAEYEKFSDAESAKKYIREKGAPIVVKTDGLAAGKGVTVARTVDEAIEAVDEMFGGKFGDAGKKIVIEEFLEGEEASFFAISDGGFAIPFGSAQDHKAVGEGDTGPNTGGMGTYSPAPVVTKEIHEEIMQKMITPLVEGMRRDGMPYKGVIFAGVMITKNGPKLLEYNIRFGDPEAQSLIPRYEGDLVELLMSAADGNLRDVNVKLSDKTALCVVMAANGYPGDYEKNTEIKNLDVAAKEKDVMIFHAGTKFENDKFYATGGRVLGVTAIGRDILDAQQKAYKAVDKIDWKGGFCRRDIGWRAVERLKKVS